MYGSHSLSTWRGSSASVYSRWRRKPCARAGASMPRLSPVNSCRGVAFAAATAGMMAFMWTLLVGLVACRAYQRHHARPGDKLVARLHHETFSKSDGVVSPT